MTSILRPINPDRYPSRLTGRAWVRCRQCRRTGMTSKRFVGNATWIDQCADCKRYGPEATPKGPTNER